MSGKKCVFCKIINGELPSQKVYQNDNIVAFLDIEPVNKGHTLIVTRRHYSSLLDVPDAELGEILQIAKRIAQALKDEFGYQAFNIHHSNGKVAGQDIEHVHFHVWPRLPDDQVELLFPIEVEYEQGEIQEVAQRIVSSLSSP